MTKAIFPELVGDRQAEEPIAYCSECGGEIYNGDEFYKVGNNIVCVDCVGKDVMTNDTL